jgi:glycosyltransferase involved in cell wall biosynthesis
MPDAVDAAPPPLRVGVLTSVSVTLDAFFPELIAAWEKRGWVVKPASGTPASVVESRVLSGVTRTVRWRNLLGARAIARWVADERLDVVITNTAVASALVRLSGSRIPVVYFCHGLHWSGSGPSVWRLVEAVLAPRTTSTIVVNPEDERWMRRRLPASRILRLEYGVGVPITRFPRTAPLEVAPPLKLAWMGEMTRRKRPELAVDLAAALRQRGVEVRLVMAGTGPHADRVGRRVASQGLGSVVQLPGQVDVPRLLAESDAVVHTAAWEGLPRVLLEAAAVGRNAYAFDVKGVRDAPSVALAPDGDVDALADLIQTQLTAGLPPQPYPDPRALDSRIRADVIADFVEKTYSVRRGDR